MTGRRAGDAAAALRGALGPAAAPPPYGRPAAVPEPPPASATAPARWSKFTVLLNQWDSLAFDGLVLRLRGRVGRRVDKAEVVRVLIGLAEDDPTLLDQIAGRLRDGGTA